jgi:hypothetical protein
MQAREMTRPAAFCLCLAAFAAFGRTFQVVPVTGVWDDKEMSQVELPLAAGIPVHHISSDYYYQIPVRPNLKTYAIYAPSREPAGYWEWLLQQEPQPAYDPFLATKTRRGTGYYKVPSLKGVWYRGPFEHNGSVATLEDWFDARRLRDDYVPTGYRGYAAAARPVRGHEFGLNLNDSDKRALIAFLNSL